MQNLLLKGKNILLIEDDRQMRFIVRNLIFSLGASDVIEASEGGEALALLAGARPHMILCDLRMQPVGGLEFVRRLRADKDNPSRFVPVIMITAHADVDTVAMARDAGATEFMAKPLSKAALEKRIQRVQREPRPFILVDGFVGPDRRRKAANGFGGRDRRMIPPILVPVDGVGQRLA
jgi:CheY-like chemotaxis protein